MQLDDLDDNDPKPVEEPLTDEDLAGEFNLDDLIEDEPQPADDEDASKKETKAKKSEEDNEGEEAPSKRWQKRTDKLTFQKHEAERREMAHRIENEQLKKRLEAIEAKQHESAVDGFKTEYETTRTELRNAIETGDTDRQVELNEKIADMRAQARLADMQAKQREARAVNPQPANQPQVTGEAQAWASRNPWFYDPSQLNKRMIAQKIDQQLTAAGYDPNSRAYFDALDQQLNQQFTSTNNSDTIEPTSRSKPQVAPTAPKTRKQSMTRRSLTPAQAQIAKELGLTDKVAIDAYLAELNKAKG